jgi:hypothetical protein
MLSESDFLELRGIHTIEKWYDPVELLKLCQICNRPSTGSTQRKMLVAIAQVLVDSVGDDPISWHLWWKSHSNANTWSNLLTRRGVSIPGPWPLFCPCLTDAL